MTDEQLFPRPIHRDAVPPPRGLVPARTVLRGRAVHLEPLDPACHGAALHRASHGSAAALAIWEYLPYGPYPDEADFQGFLRDGAGALDRVVYTICDAKTGEAAGLASYLDIQPKAGVIEIGGIWFAPALQRRPAATEALFLMLTYALDDLGYRRMQWRCNAANAKSRAAATRLGFRFEGIWFNHMITKGRNRDTA